MKNIAFDFDFTLADTSASILSSLEFAFHTSGFRPKLSISDDFSKVKGLKLREQIVAIAGESVPNSDLNFMIEQFMNFYRKEGMKKTVLYPGIYELFDFFSGKDIATHIVSAKSKVNLVATIEFFELKPTKLIGGVALGEKVDYLISEGCSTYVGDMDIDVEISRRAGCNSVILHAPKNQTYKWNNQADFYFDTLQEFISWVEDEKNLAKL
jgi:phosphoglycolate phosphatase-like HAD superfamily hydrolase